MFDMTGKVAIVTGSSRGIGKSIAVEMAKQGAKVVISARDIAACEEVANEIIGSGGTAIAIQANISDQNQIVQLVAQTRKAFGPVDVLVCNAASNPYFGPLEKLPDETFAKIMNNNVLSNIWLVRQVLPDMRAKRDGSIIIISSIGGLRGTATLGAYGISKAADMALSRNLAIELGADNIRVNTIAPGLIKTKFAVALWSDEKILSERLERQPIKRLGEPEDVSGVAVMLASRAGKFITGQVIVVDGGVLIA